MSDLTTDFSITLEKAREYAKNWRDPKTEFDHTALHAFLIPKDSMQRIIDEMPDTGIRAYLGISETGEPKLMIVGTKYNHQMQTHDDMLPESESPGRIYDFTVPCPRACGYMSPLNDLSL
jgi:hypothetical protein